MPKEQPRSSTLYLEGLLSFVLGERLAKKEKKEKKMVSLFKQDVLILKESENLQFFYTL